jgi:hypothetical protein
MEGLNMAEDKVDKPHARYDAPHDVVADHSLSKSEKAEALQSLEQDALQLSIASGEGMSGGEPSNLDEVREAKESLDSHPTEYAYEVVLRDLRKRMADASDDAKSLIENAVNALEAAQHTRQLSPNPPPGSDAEVAKEAELEKLDP